MTEPRRFLHWIKNIVRKYLLMNLNRFHSIKYVRRYVFSKPCKSRCLKAYELF